MSAAFLLKKTNIAFALFFLLVACSQKKEQNGSYIHRMLDTLTIGHNGNALIYTINPNDCVSCLNGFKLFDETFKGAKIPVVYVISINRALEKQQLIKTITSPNLDPAPNKAVIWSKEVLDSLNLECGRNLPLTSLIVYNYTKDSVLFSAPIREINDMALVKEMLGLELK